MKRSHLSLFLSVLCCGISLGCANLGKEVAHSRDDDSVNFSQRPDGVARIRPNAPSVERLLPVSVSAKPSSIYYLDGGGAKCRATLNQISRGFFGYPNPDWAFYRPDGALIGKDQWLTYQTWDGSVWKAEARTHENALNMKPPTVDFEHKRVANQDDKHDDVAIGFRGWDGTKYRATVETVTVDYNRNIYRFVFNIEPKP